MAGITLAKAIRVFNRELDCGADREELIDQITKAIEFLLLHGGGEILREWKVIARDGRFTLPRDLGTPVKYKFCRLPNAGFGSFNSPYYSYSSNALKKCCDYKGWDVNFEVKANEVATQYPVPSCGARIVITTKNEEDVGKQVMVGGKYRGNPIAGMHNGYKTSGELLPIQHEDAPEKVFSSYVFDEITHITKDETCGWVKLSGLSTDTSCANSDNEWYHLGYMHPDEETACYREVEMFSCPQTCCDVEISILGRIDPTIRYIRDEDILPISSTLMLDYLAKRARYEESGDLAEVASYEQRIMALIRKRVVYQQPPVKRLSFSAKSAGSHNLTDI